MSSVVTVVSLVVAGYLGILLLGDLYLIAVHLFIARAHIEKDRRALMTATLPADSALPKVCVQIPVHNEQLTVTEAIDAACAQHWPKDRLEIQVLDDGSTDKTAEVAAAVIAARTQAPALRLYSRPERSEFKAGVLRFGLRRTTAEYVAVFDVDYRPTPDVLRKLMNILLLDPNLAFVQARLDYRNRNNNWLTRAQATELDMVMAFELATRSWNGLPLPFSGTCGIWRRAAIESAGGWLGRSLSEDLDLSFRALALGWRSRFLTSIPVPGELPVSYRALWLQRSRWSTGISQQFRYWPWALHKQLPLHKFLAFFLLFQFHAFVRSGLLLMAGCLVFAWAAAAEQAWIIALALISLISAVVVSRSIGALLAMRVLGRGIDLYALTDLLLMWLLQLILLPVGALSGLGGLFKKSAVFHRTPKGQ